MDLLDFQPEALYFEEPLLPESQRCLDLASSNIAEGGAEGFLLRAYFLEPEHPVVLVALYRFYYYRHRLEDALRVAERLLKAVAKQLELPTDWRELTPAWLGSAVMVSMALIRFYMLALKGAGYLELRLGRFESALQRLEKVVELDTNDRLGTRALLEIARKEVNGRALAS